MQSRKIDIDLIKEYYVITEEGEVISKDRVVNNNGGYQLLKGKKLKPNINTKRKNYVQIALSINGKPHTYHLHKLVAFAYPEICGKWFEGAEIDHIDGNVLNNAARNLRFVNKSGNMCNPITRERCGKAKSKSVLQYSLSGEFIKEWVSASEASRVLGITRANISDCCLGGRCKTAGGYIWKFI